MALLVWPVATMLRTLELAQRQPMSMTGRAARCCSRIQPCWWRAQAMRSELPQRSPIAATSAAAAYAVGATLAVSRKRLTQHG